MSLENVKGGVFLSTDGQIDPTGLTNALAAGGKSRGAIFLMNTRVTGITVSNNEVREVVTDKGVIKTASGTSVLGRGQKTCFRRPGSKW